MTSQPDDCRDLHRTLVDGVPLVPVDHWGSGCPHAVAPACDAACHVHGEGPEFHVATCAVTIHQEDHAE